MTIDSYLTRNENETLVQRKWRDFKTSQKSREFAEERIIQSKDRVQELRNISLSKIIYCAEIYSHVLTIGDNYSPLSDDFPKLERISIGEVNTATLPARFGTDILPGTRTTLFYCLEDEGLIKHKYNSVHDNAYQKKTISRNPVIDQIEMLGASSTTMGTVFSLPLLFGTKPEYVPLAFLAFCGMVLGQLALPHSKRDREEASHDRMAWRLYQRL